MNILCTWVWIENCGWKGGRLYGIYTVCGIRCIEFIGYEKQCCALRLSLASILVVTYASAIECSGTSSVIWIGLSGFSLNSMNPIEHIISLQAGFFRSSIAEGIKKSIAYILYIYSAVSKGVKCLSSFARITAQQMRCDVCRLHTFGQIQWKRKLLCEIWMQAMNAYLHFALLTNL